MRSLLLLLIAGCTIDLSVGRISANEDADPDSGIHPDAAELDASEADASEPDAGDPDSGGADAGMPAPRTLQISATPTLMCADSLAGREVEFAALRAADVSLSGGAIGYAVFDTSVILTGAPIEAAFQSEQLVLREDVVPDQPPGTFLAAVPITGGPSGPADTMLNVAAAFVDTLVDPPAGEAGFQFETPSLDGACFVSFSIVLLP